MSRVHDALRKAAQEPQSDSPRPGTPTHPAPVTGSGLIEPYRPAAIPDLLADVETCPYDPLPDALLVKANKPREAPAE